MVRYIPVLKTSDAELRAVKFLDRNVKEETLPLFELTRSRKTKSLPEGSAKKRLEQIFDIYGDNPFILDLCTEPELMNEEMLDFFDQSQGYKKWTDFLDLFTGAQITPCLLYEEDGDKEEFIKQAEILSNSFKRICIRGSYADALVIRKLYNWATEVVPEERIYIGGSVYFIPQGMLPNYELMGSQFLIDAIGNNAPAIAFVSSSSFPKSVGIGDYGDDQSGEFEALETRFTEALNARFLNINLVHSDYASVHPIRYQTKAYGWVPRIDGVLDGSFAFERYRQHDGGYLAAAKKLYANHSAELIDCWGSRQIVEAATKGKLGGRSPSFWISARINQWITRHGLV